MKASAKLPFYYAYPSPFLCPSGLSDCYLWIRSSAGYFGAFGSAGKPATDQIESEVGTSSKRRCGKNSGWNTGTDAPFLLPLKFRDHFWV